MRSFFRGLGRFFWRFMVIFSFIVNLVLVVVILALVLMIFDIKNNIATPLVAGLHSSFVGLDNATIDWTIPVREDVPVKLNIPIDTNTVVVLTEDVPLTVDASISGDVVVRYARVTLTLPKDLELPVKLDLAVNVDDTLPVELDVRAVIPLQDTQLHDVADSLRLLLEPMAVGLYNLPDDFGGAIQMVGDTLSGNPPNLLEANQYSIAPWQGFSMTAGLNYPEHLLTAPIPEENIPVETGIVPLGGIPALDEQIRPQLYADGNNPRQRNQFSSQSLETDAIPPVYYTGAFAQYRNQLRAQTPVTTMQSTDDSEVTIEENNGFVNPSQVRESPTATATP
jgi:hypothetical protein